MKAWSIEAKLFAGAVVAVVVYALYVRSRRTTGGSSTTSGAVAAPLVVNSSGEARQLSNSLAQALAGMEARATAQFEGLARVQREAATGFVGALNEQGTTLAETLKAFADREAGAFANVTASIGNVAQYIQQLQALVANAFQANAAQVAAVAEGVTGATQKLTALDAKVAEARGAIEAKLASEAEARTSAFATFKTWLTGERALDSLVWADYVAATFGTQSVAACVDRNGNVDAQCTKTHAIDLPSFDFRASEVADYVERKYPECTGKFPYDLVCIGRKIAAERGLTLPKRN